MLIAHFIIKLRSTIIGEKQLKLRSIPNIRYTTTNMKNLIQYFWFRAFHIISYFQHGKTKHPIAVDMFMCVYVYLCVEMCRMSKSLCPLSVLLISQIKSYHAQLPPDSSLFHLPYYCFLFLRQYVPFCHHHAKIVHVFFTFKNCGTRQSQCK